MQCILLCRTTDNFDYNSFWTILAFFQSQRSHQKFVLKKFLNMIWVLGKMILHIYKFFAERVIRDWVVLKFLVSRTIHGNNSRYTKKKLFEEKILSICQKIFLTQFFIHRTIYSSYVKIFYPVDLFILNTLTVTWNMYIHRRDRIYLNTHFFLNIFLMSCWIILIFSYTFLYCMIVILIN